MNPGRASSIFNTLRLFKLQTSNENSAHVLITHDKLYVCVVNFKQEDRISNQ
jgi:hypothetical protein